MKKIHILLVVGLLLGLAACSTSQTASSNTGDGARQRTVSTTGEAEVRVVPDEVVLTVGVQTWNEDLVAAKAENDETVRKAIQVATEVGIDPKHIQTEYVSIEPRYRDSYQVTDFIGYFVRKTIVLTLNDLTRFEELLSRLLDSGVNYVHGIDFRTTELRKHRDSARELAVQAAREKAVALAGALGQEVGDPVSIQEEYNGWLSGYGYWWGSGYNSATQNVVQNVGGSTEVSETVLAPGQISVTARVSVQFDLK